MDIRTTEVLIVGGGPVGLFGTHLLSRGGIDVINVEKYPSRLSIPKAHALNPRSLEICSAAGLPMDALHAASTPSGQGGYVRFMSTLSGAEIGKLPYERQDEAVRKLTPWPLINIAQPSFEKIIEDTLKNSGHNSRRLNSAEWLGCTEEQGSVLSHMRPRGAPDNGADDFYIRSQYLIGADGAMSSVRDVAGIGLSGDEALAHCITIHFEADLTSIAGDRPAILYFLFGVKRGAALIAYDITKTWVLMHRYDPLIKPAASFTQTEYEKAVRAAIGTDFDFEIKAARPWTMAAQVAKTYSKGRIYLAGDAAHRFPPTGGLGLNSGLGDIDNLCWKLAAILNGTADENLLRSYDTERRHVAIANAAQSAINAKRMRVLTAALGQGGAVNPKTPVSDKDVELALLAHINAPGTQDDIAAGIAEQKQHFDSLRLQLGYIYGPNRDIEKDAPINIYTPKTIPGAYLPHVKIRGNGSILDKVETTGFTLLTGRSGVSEAVKNQLGALDIPLTIKTEGQDFSLNAGQWSKSMGLMENGALLVRPDRHILFKALSLNAASIADMKTELDLFLGLRAKPLS